MSARLLSNLITLFDEFPDLGLFNSEILSKILRRFDFWKVRNRISLNFKVALSFVVHVFFFLNLVTLISIEFLISSFTGDMFLFGFRFQHSFGKPVCSPSMFVVIRVRSFVLLFLLILPQLLI
jgi:hypothetical protein